MAGASGRGGVAPTLGAAFVAFAVLVAVLVIVREGGGLVRHVQTVELTPRERATAERLTRALPAPPARQG